LGWIKSITQRGKDLPLRDGLALESSAFVQYFATSPHPQEGIRAFKEKRQPEF
jgi:enoyl-CoA hydratase/carnithine racemase